MLIRSRGHFFTLLTPVTKLYPVGVLAMLCAAAGCTLIRSKRVEELPSAGIEISWGVVTNTPGDGSGFVSELILHNQGGQG